MGGRANVWDCRKLEWVIMKVMVMARGGGGGVSMVQQLGTSSTGMEK